MIIHLFQSFYSFTNAYSFSITSCKSRDVPKLVCQSLTNLIYLAVCDIEQILISVYLLLKGRENKYYQNYR